MSGFNLPEKWLGRVIGFEGPDGEGSIESYGKVTDEDETRIYVEGKTSWITGWYYKSEIVEDE